MVEKKVDLIIGHLGTNFHGSQIQPDIRTVQGVLGRVLSDLNWSKESVKPPPLCSRTDTGVHAAMNIFRITIPTGLVDEKGLSGCIGVLRTWLDDDLFPLGVVEADDTSVRWALNRTYRYVLHGIEGWDSPTANDLDFDLEMFLGSRDWSAFRRFDPDADPLRTVEAMLPLIDDDGRVIGFEIKAPSFLRSMVRRIGGALIDHRSGRVSTDQVVAALEGDRSIGFRTAPASRLILWHIERSNLNPPSTEASKPWLSGLPDTSALGAQMEIEARIEQAVIIEARRIASDLQIN